MIFLLIGFPEFSRHRQKLDKQTLNKIPTSCEQAEIDLSRKSIESFIAQNPSIICKIFEQLDFVKVKNICKFFKFPLCHSQQFFYFIILHVLH